MRGFQWPALHSCASAPPARRNSLRVRPLVKRCLFPAESYPASPLSPPPSPPPDRNNNPPTSTPPADGCPTSRCRQRATGCSPRWWGGSSESPPPAPSYKTSRTEKNHPTATPPAAQSACDWPAPSPHQNPPPGSPEAAARSAPHPPPPSPPSHQ